MSTRQQVQDNIQTKLASAQSGGITAEQHRGALAEDIASILKNLYGTSVTETNASGNILTPNGNFNYTVQITKIGNIVNLCGNAQALGNGNTVVFDVANSEYQPLADSNLGSSYKQLTENAVKIDARGDNNRIEVGTLTLGEIIDFNITYIVAP